MHKYRMMVYHVADTPATIRQCDIYRLTTLAQERGCLRGFCRWLLRQRPDLKLLTWCRFVPELRRYLREVSAAFGHPVGAACGQKVFDESKSVKAQREAAMSLLHPVGHSYYGMLREKLNWNRE